LTGQAYRRFDGTLEQVTVGSYPLVAYPDGRILYHFLQGSSQPRFWLARLSATGSLDGTHEQFVFNPRDVQQQFVPVYDPFASATIFPTNGVFTATPILFGAALLPDGGTIIVGSFTAFGDSPGRGVVKVRANGTVDLAFSAGGGPQYTTIAETATRVPTVEAVHLLPSGMLLVVGDFEAFNGVPAPGIALLRSNGEVVANFTTPVTRVVERAARAKLFPQSDGSLMLSGPYRFAGETTERSIVRLQVGQALAVTGAASRKTHGTAGQFDVQLPLAGRGVESRMPAAGGAHTLVFSFNNDIQTGGASIVSGAGNVSNTTISGHTAIVQLTGVANSQTVTIALDSVVDVFGQALPPQQVQIGFLVGDTNGDGFVNAGDALQTRSRSGQEANGANFRSDVNADGVVNGGDAIVVRSRSGTTLSAGSATERE
jgi:hypothetical protein